MKKVFKKLKGFTLIELLAVLVVLLIIALIAIPLVLNMIEDSRRKAAVISGRNYVKAVDYKIAQEELKGHITPLGEYVIGENELEVNASNIENITGSYEIASKGVLTAGLCVNGYSVEYSNGKAYYKKDINYCGDAYVFEEPNGVILSSICEGASGNTIYQDNTEFKIKTVEDLACFSQLVNGGKDFSGKKVYLLNNLDISNASSYKQSTTTKYGDINGNETTEELLTELTTGKGFKPIGNNSNKFSGTFLGYAYTISNLMIDRTTDYTGLFGYNQGTINGVILRNANIKGAAQVGGVAGYNKKTIKNIDVKGNITGTGNYVGGVIGSTDSQYTSSKSLMYSGYVKGNNYVGGLTGQGWDVEGAVYDSTLETTYNSTSSIGYCSAGGIANCKRNNTTLKMKTNRYNSAPDGVALSSENLRLNMIDGLVDTYIGGDNDSDGYYFDYDSTNNITLYSTERTPIQNKLKGNGTEDKPYIINNMKNWKMATATITQNKYYSITSDLDFGGDLLYAFGTDSNKFNGNLNGNMNTLGNINVEGYDYVGVIGYNNGTVSGIKFDDVNIEGLYQYAGIVGYNNGTINGVSAKNLTVKGAAQVGGVAGYNKKTIKNIDIRGNITGTGNYVGGVIGSTDSQGTSSKSLMYSGYVKGNNYVGGLAGQGWTVEGAVYDSTLETTYGSTSSLGYCSAGGIANCKRKSVNLVMKTNRNSAQDGVVVSNTKLRLNMIDGLVDTYIAGDNDSDGYYFDYDSNNNITVYSTVKTPIQNTLSGSGTQASPYLIKNLNDWKMATATVTQGKYYSITSDLDFGGDLLYAFGTSSNKFNGNLNGNMNTLKNIDVEGYDYVGVIGYNDGTISGIKFDGVNVLGLYQYTGIIGYNNGTINGVSAKNLTSKGAAYVGGLAGYNKKTIKNIDIRGNITGTGSYVGGVIGGTDSQYTSSKSLMYSGYVKGNNYVGGLAGQGWDVEGTVYDSTLETTYNSTSSLGYCSAGGIANCKRKSVNLVMKTNRSGAQDGVIVSNTKLRLNMIDGLVDTYIAGDNDSDGYYFDYDSSNNITVYSTVKTPIQNTLSGSGTQASPYLIKNLNDWKMATATVTQNKYYSITSDLDFGNDLLYAFGTSSNKFNGNLNGNAHTLSSINVEGYDYVGVIGYNNGTVRGIKFNNPTVKGIYQYVGIIGYNNGTINGISVRGVTANGDYYVGGLTGHNKNTIKNVDVRGNITASNSYVGGIAGATDSQGTSTTGTVFKGTITAKNYVGGLVGQGWGTSGVVYDSTLETTYTSTSSLGKCAASGTANCKNKNITLKMKTNRSGAQDGTSISEITTATISDRLDTTDSDSDGYYFTVTDGEIQLAFAN